MEGEILRGSAVSLRYPGRGSWVTVKHTHSGGMDPQAKANSSLSSLGDLGQVSWALFSRVCKVRIIRVFTSWVSLGELREMKYGKPSA